MKVTKIKLILLLVMFVVASLAFVNGNSYANGGWVSYTWKQYKIKFEVPSNFKVKQNNAQKFIAGDSHMTFEIYPWKDPNVTAKDVADRALDDLSIDDYDSAESQVYEQDDFNGFKGYEVVGTGTQKGKGIGFRVFGLIDPEGATNFAAYCVYWRDSLEDDNASLAKEIFETISKM